MPSGADVEPLIQVARRTVCLLARHMLGGAVLQDRKEYDVAARVDERAPRSPEPACASLRIDEPALDQLWRERAAQVFGKTLAHFTAEGVVFLGLQCQRVLSQQLLAVEAAELHIGFVDRDQPEMRILQRGGKRRVPEHADQFASRVAVGLACHGTRPHRVVHAQGPMAGIEAMDCDPNAAPIGQRDRQQLATGRRFVRMRNTRCFGSRTQEGLHSLCAESADSLFECDGQPVEPRCAHQLARRCVGQHDASCHAEHEHRIAQAEHEIAQGSGQRGDRLGCLHAGVAPRCATGREVYALPPCRHLSQASHCRVS